MISTAKGLSIARQHCSPECYPYHAAWKVFCRLNIKSQPRWHAGFYTRALDRLHLLHQDTTALICGAAADSMLATLAELVRLTSVRIIDKCESPLVMSRAYAARAGIKCVYERILAQDLDPEPDTYDLVISDGLLSLVGSAQARAEVIGRIYRCLKPGGGFIYSTRLTKPRTNLEYDVL
jgi:2-polyprenyl-3-methyl-5-hydroxy-6-metoxy-1,4-benzoquinol methylase